MKQKELSGNLGCVALAALLFVTTHHTASAQAQAPAPATATTPNTGEQLSTAQLEQLVAPIALYPDALLSQVLMASTYPLEVVAAARWAASNPGVTGKRLEDAMAAQPWDPSVKALAAVPQTLQMMNDKLDWMQTLGDAFLAQQADVLAAVQRLRARADAAGKLESNQNQKVVKMTTPPPEAVAPSGGGAAPRGSGVAPSVGAAPSGPVYVIESTNPDQYSVPIYDPMVAYGTWPYPDYQPYYWYPPGYAAAGWWGFGAAALTGAAIWAGVNWWRNGLTVNPQRYASFNRNTNINNINRNWAHNPAHRGGVPYRNAGVANKFGGANRVDARNRAQQGLNKGLNKGGGRQNLGGQGGRQNLGGATKGPKTAGKGGGAGKGKVAGGKGGAGKGKVAGKGGAGKGKAAGAGRGKGGASTRHATNRGGAKNRAGANRSAARGGARSAGVNRSAINRGAVHRGGGGMHRGGGMSRSAGMRAGGMRAGGGMRGGGGRGGGRRSDIRLKHDIALLGHLDNGLGFYRFAYNGSDKAYVGVMAQEVRHVVPAAVTQGRDGWLRVNYDRLGVRFQSYDQWLGSGAHIPLPMRLR